MSNVSNINKLSEISDQYDAFLIDAWGVLHDGGKVFPHAYDCLKQLKAQGKIVVILSNAARRTTDFDKELLATGIDQSVFDFSLSSGELLWQNFKSGRYEGLGSRCYYLGPKRSQGILEGLDLSLVNTLEQADFIINAGAEGNTSDASSYQKLLQNAVDRNLPMVCANPDLIAIRKGVRGISAGAIAKLYQQLGGKVEYIGKPHKQIYQDCLAKLAGIPDHKVLMIGDGLQTDILGANDQWIDALFITSGIYNQQFAEASRNDKLAELFFSEGALPDYMIEALVY
ncbi:MAG: TIGR01459 family HAD-type hydrolase [Cocleimonas sp.]|nr:TIGR01459 family HAD-type hydrolase [Cocleimonas sp.]